MEMSNRLLCLFNAEVTVADGEYVVPVPTREIETGTIEPGETYRIALVEREVPEDEPTQATDPGEPQPPVEPGEIRYVEIEDLGKQGDGIARVERGYVIIVPGADVGDRVKVEITEVKSNFAVGEAVEDGVLDEE
jgi:predicted RNA-binding protein with TRAM domain